MGVVTYAVEKHTDDQLRAQDNPHFIGGIDFAHLPHRALTKVVGDRTPGFQVIFRQSALNRVHAHGNSSPRAEVCGVLVGDVYQDDVGGFLLVEQIIEGESSARSAGQVTFTADTWQQIQLELDKQYPDLRIVGWYHTHPGHGVFLSEMDIFLHESFFGLPWQAALVYDPRNGEEGVFSAAQGQAHRLDFVTEVDETATTQTFHSPVYHAAPLPEPELPRPIPVVHVRKGRFWHPFRQIILALIGLTLFAVFGALLGLLILFEHIEIPYWIQQMVHG